MVYGISESNARFASGGWLVRATKDTVSRFEAKGRPSAFRRESLQSEKSSASIAVKTRKSDFKLAGKGLEKGQVRTSFE